MGRRRKAAFAALGVTGVLAAAACAPYFGEGSTLTATQYGGQLAKLTWTAALPMDAGTTVTEYGIELNGSEVTRYSAANGTSCVLTGLAPGASYTISITAYNAANENSGGYGGDLAASARVSANYTNGTLGASAGSSPTCVPLTDSDGDRLPDLLETNNGQFLNATATGTNKNNADTDADGIKDGDEVLDTTAGLKLYEMGTRPTKKDLLFEYDWFDDNLDNGSGQNQCAAHSHRPTAAMVQRATDAFAALNTTNPSGSKGVNVINDYGQGGNFTGGNKINDADGVIAGGVNNADFINYKAANFAANREGYFHYVLLPHRYDTTSGSSGQAELPGDDMIVSLQCFSSTVNTGNTIMHEVGHNLNLRHGGNVDTNYKRDYNSVMNYLYQFPGIDTTCDSNGDGVLSYSVGTRIPLNESALVEANGVCGPGTVALDWNGDSLLTPGTVAVDLNGDTVLNSYADFNDHLNLCLTCINDADGASPSSTPTSPELITEQPVPDEAK